MLAKRTSEYCIGLPIAVLLVGLLPSAYGLKALHGCSRVNRRVKARGVVPVFPVFPALLFSSGPNMKAQTPHNRNITPVKAQKILLENNIEVSEKEAEKILDFLYFLAKLTVNQYVNEVSKADLERRLKPSKSIKSKKKVKIA